MDDLEESLNFIIITFSNNNDLNREIQKKKTKDRKYIERQ